MKVYNDSQVDSRIYSTYPKYDYEIKSQSFGQTGSLRIQDSYEIRTSSNIPNQQIFGSLSKASNNFVLQMTPSTYSPVWQDIEVVIEGSFGSGYYKTVQNQDGQVVVGGLCKEDTGHSITCNLGVNDPGDITLTLRGGHTPSPVKDPVDMTYQGEWVQGEEYMDNTYGKKNFVSYKGKNYAACANTNWISLDPPSQIAAYGEKQPWAVYNGEEGIIERNVSPCNWS